MRRMKFDTEAKRREFLLRSFWSNVNKNGPTVRIELGHCWVWTGKLSSGGYGNFQMPIEGNRTARNASRAAWWLKHGDPGKLFVCHKCDNPRCVRPDHLFLGTDAENKEDMRRKGRLYLGGPKPMATRVPRIEANE